MVWYILYNFKLGTLTQYLINYFLNNCYADMFRKLCIKMHLDIQ